MEEEIKLFGDIDNETKSNFSFRLKFGPIKILVYFYVPQLINTRFKIKKSKKLSKVLFCVGTRGVR